MKLGKGNKRDIFVLLALLCLFATGCGNQAEKLKEDGLWEEQGIVYSSNTQSVDSVRLAVKVNQEMTDEQMNQVMEYYWKKMKKDCAKGNTPMPKGTEFVIYGVFYDGDTNEQLKGFKYQDGKDSEVTKDDESIFGTIMLDVQYGNVGNE